jgi:hypothetical protein
MKKIEYYIQKANKSITAVRYLIGKKKNNLVTKGYINSMALIPPSILGQQHHDKSPI